MGAISTIGATSTHLPPLLVEGGDMYDDCAVTIMAMITVNM